MREANRLIYNVVAQDHRIQHLDIDTPMIGAHGKPKRDLFIEDGLHPSSAGYRLWADLLRPHLVATLVPR